MTDVSLSDPLASIRSELVAAAGRRIARRRRRRRTTTVTAAVLALMAAAAGASELTGFSTGVPVVDRLLDGMHHPEPSGEPVRMPDGSEVAPPPIPDIRPGPGGASDPLPAPGLAGGAGGVAVAYLSRDGLVCSAYAADARAGSVRGGGGGCYLPRQLARMLDRRGAVCCSLAAGPERRVYEGHVDADVVAVRLLVPSGPVSARLTEPWTPQAPGAQPQRYFVGVDETDIDVGGDGVQPDEINLISTLPPRLELEYEDGRVVEVDPVPRGSRARAARLSRRGGPAAPAPRGR